MLYRRMKAVACRYWQVPPWELDRRIAAGDVTFQDIKDLLFLLGNDMAVGPWLSIYLSPETVERIKTEKRQVNQKLQFGKLLNFIKPKNDKEARFLERLKQEVNTDGP